MAKKTESQQDQLLHLLISGSAVGVACKSVGVRRQTYHLWLTQNTDGFRDRLEQSRREMRESYQHRLESIVNDAITSLEKDLLDFDWRARHSAAKLILEAFNAAKLIAIEQKLNELEGNIRTIDIY